MKKGTKVRAVQSLQDGSKAVKYKSGQNFGGGGDGLSFLAGISGRGRAELPGGEVPSISWDRGFPPHL